MTAILEKKGAIASIIINRPEKLNILNAETISTLKEYFLQCEEDPEIQIILLTSQGERAFSAGGDVKEVYYASKEQGHYAYLNFDHEFELNKIIMNSSKIIVSHLKGIAMGGGVAITLGGDFSLVDETTDFALPEIDLGMIPDVGLGYYISKLDQTHALYLSLLGRTIHGSDAVKFGFASHYIAHKSWPDIQEKILNLSLEGKSKEDSKKEILEIIEDYSLPLEKTPLQKEIEEMDKHFSQSSLKEILASLEKDPSPLAKKVLEEIRHKCPIASNIAFLKYFAGKNWNREETFEHDRRILAYCYEEGNMIEGIEATLIRKDKANFPGSIEEINLEEMNELVYGKGTLAK